MNASGIADGVPCPSTGASITLNFSATIVSVDGLVEIAASLEPNVNFFVADLEATSTEFDIGLDTCSVANGTDIVNAVAYSDDQGNDPDLSGLMAAGSVSDCDSGTYVLLSSSSSGKLMFIIL